MRRASRSSGKEFVLGAASQDEQRAWVEQLSAILDSQSPHPDTGVFATIDSEGGDLATLEEGDFAMEGTLEAEQSVFVPVSNLESTQAAPAPVHADSDDVGKRGLSQALCVCVSVSWRQMQSANRFLPWSSRLQPLMRR